MRGSDFPAIVPLSLWFRLVQGCALFCAMSGISLVTAHASCQARCDLHPRERQTRLACLRYVCCCLLASKNHRPVPMPSFRGYSLDGRLHPLPLRLACFLAYASSDPLLGNLQGWILDLGLAVIKAGFSPASVCDIAKPQLRTDPSFREQSCRSVCVGLQFMQPLGPQLRCSKQIGTD